MLACLALLLLPLGVRAQEEPAAGGETLAAPAVPAARQADNVAVITIRGPIDKFTELSVKRRIAAAEASGADAMVFELDTPGGDLFAVLEITQAIKGSAIRNTVAWVRPKAYSGGAIIAVACREIVVGDPASFGDALIIQASPAGGAAPLPDELRPKLLSPLIADVVDSARRNGYDEYLVQAFVTLGIELWLVRDTRTGRTLAVNEAEMQLLVPGRDPARTSPIAPSIGQNEGAETERRRADANAEALGETVEKPTPGDEIVGGSSAFKPASDAVADLADDIETTLGTPTTRPALSAGDAGSYELVGYIMDGNGPLIVRQDTAFTLGFASGRVTSDADLAAYFGATNVRRIDQSWSESLVRVLSSLPVRGLLVAVFLIALFMEMTNPGVALPGAVAVIALVMLLAPPFMIGMASWWEIAAIVLGVFLIALEILVIPGFGVFGVLGLVSLFGGLVGTFVRQEPGRMFPDSQAAQTDLLYGIATVSIGVVTALIGMYFVGKHFGSLPLVNKLVLRSDHERGSDREEMLASLATDPREALVGRTGTALTPLRPSGRARLDDAGDGSGNGSGDVIDVAAGRGWVDAGARVRVVAVDGLRTVVEAMDSDRPLPQPEGTDQQTDGQDGARA